MGRDITQCVSLRHYVEGTFPKPGGTRGYDSYSDRMRAVRALRREGFNYFVFYRDVVSRFALQYAVSEWVTRERGPDGVYIDW